MNEDSAQKYFVSGLSISTTHDPVDLEPGTELLDGRYTIERLLGRGGFAAVYLAHDRLRKEEVAVKVAESGPCDPETARLMLAHENRVLSRIKDYRHVIKVYDLQYAPWGITGLLLLSMEYADAGSLRKWLLQYRDDVETRRTQGFEYFKQICEGLAAVHATGTAHLDLKPENCLFVNEALKVSDFGSARCLQTLQMSSTIDVTFLNRCAGTPAYMSPEQIQSAHPEDVDHRADIYALGCIAYEMFHEKCHPPFGGTREEILQRHLNMTPPPLGGVDENVARVVARCLEKLR